jgi:hypothetical protein
MPTFDWKRNARPRGCDSPRPGDLLDGGLRGGTREAFIPALAIVVHPAHHRLSRAGEVRDEHA